MANFLVCRNCERDVSNPIDFIEESKYGIDRSSPATDYIVPLGKGVLLNVRRGFEDDPIVVWMNGNDLLERIRFDKKGFGCCGYNGEPNTICECSQIVGATYTDCCDAHRFQPDAAASYWSEVSENDPSRLEKIYAKSKVRKNRF